MGRSSSKGTGTDKETKRTSYETHFSDRRCEVIGAVVKIPVLWPVETIALHRHILSMYLFSSVVHPKLTPALFDYFSSLTFLDSLKLSPKDGSGRRQQTSTIFIPFKEGTNSFHSGVFMQALLSRAVACLCSNDDTGVVVV